MSFVMTDDAEYQKEISRSTSTDLSNVETKLKSYTKETDTNTYLFESYKIVRDGILEIMPALKSGGNVIDDVDMNVETVDIAGKAAAKIMMAIEDYISNRVDKKLETMLASLSQQGNEA